MLRKASLIISSLIFTIAAAGVFASQPSPDYWPTCSSPQNIAPMQVVGSASGYRISGIAWNGKEYGVEWVAPDGTLQFRRIFADGTAAAPAVTLSTLAGNASDSSALVWNGSNYAAVWTARGKSDAYNSVYFIRFDSSGTVIGSPVKVSFVSQTETADCAEPKLAWSGGGYAVVWQDDRNSSTTGYDIFATLLNPDGTVANSGTSHDLNLTAASNSQSACDVAWDASRGQYTVAWSDFRSGSKLEVYGTTLTPTGTFVKGGSLIATSSGNSYVPSLASTGAGLGMAWDDDHTGVNQIYFALLSGVTEVSPVSQVSTSSDNSSSSALVWTGAEFGAFWTDYVSGGSNNTWFREIDASGVPQGSSKQVTFAADSANGPNADFAKYGYMTSQIAGSSKFVEPLGCVYPYAPSCPNNVIAYGVSTSTATISWQPVDGNGTDIAYYQVLQDNNPIAKTDNNYYTAMGLTSGTTYNFSVIAVNAAQKASTGCSSTTSSVYVKPSAAVTLTVSKSSPDALLSWTDSSNMTSYNVYRGTSPQVMQKLGNTSTQTFDDANALTNNNVYFYTVDDPGQ